LAEKAQKLRSGGHGLGRDYRSMDTGSVTQVGNITCVTASSFKFLVAHLIPDLGATS